MVLGRLIVSLAAGAILYACLHSHSKLVRGDWVVRLGKISYGLYMLHLTGILLCSACSARSGDGNYWRPKLGILS